MSHYGDHCFKEDLYWNIMTAIHQAQDEYEASNTEILQAVFQIIADDVIPELMEDSDVH